MHTISTAVVHTGGLKCYLAKEISKVAAILHNTYFPNYYEGFRKYKSDFK